MITLDRIVHHGHGHAHGHTAQELVLDFDIRQKSRFKATTQQGIEVGVFLAPGTILRGGDVLGNAAGDEVLVSAAPEPVVEVVAEHPLALLRAAYHLGNRHVRLQVQGQALRLQTDSVLEAMLAQLGGLQLRHLSDAFEPEAGAYGGGHGHSHDGHSHDHDHGHAHDHPHAHPSGSARIHEFA